MARFGDILWKSKLVAAGITLSVIPVALSGCGANEELQTLHDRLMPTFNDEDRLIVSPDTYYSLIGELEEEDYWVNGGESEGAGDEDIGEVTTTFAKLPYTAIAASSYSQYLDSYVYKPLSDLVLASGMSGSLYLRVFHSGYEPYSNSQPYIKQGASYDNKMLGSIDRIGGTALQEFSLDYLLSYFGNSNSVSKAISNWQYSVNKLGISPTARWEQMAEELESYAAKSTQVRVSKLWGNPELAFDTFDDYCKSFYTERVSTIPNLSLKIETPSVTNISLNNVDLATTRYSDFMTKSDVDKLFSSYNISEQRDREALVFSDVQEQIIVSAYVDGYSKTIVVLACEPDKSLQDLLGSRYSEAASIIAGLHYYTDWEYISECVEDAVLLQSGSRGVN